MELIEIILWSILIILTTILLYYLLKDTTKNMESVKIDIDDIIDLYSQFDEIHQRQRMTTRNTARRRRDHRNRAENYFHPDWEADAENVHDSQVVRELVKKYNKLDELVPDEPPTELYINQNDWIEGLREATMLEIKQHITDDDAIETLQKIATSVIPISSISGGRRIAEQDILCKVWMRIQQLPKETSEDMKNNLQTVLIDASAGDYTVCPHGRMARILSIFIHVDPDEVLSEPIKDAQIVRQEAFQKTFTVLQQELVNKKMHAIYNKLEPDDVEKEKLKRFTSDLKDKLVIILTEDYGNILEKNKLGKLIEECCSGI